jgi:hypothetical protein
MLCSHGTAVPCSANEAANATFLTQTAGGVNECCADPGADVWRWNGLGKRAFEMWRHLGRNPIPTVDLAKSLGVQIRTAKHHLNRLKQYELAEELIGGWVRGTADLDEVAQVLGVAGARNKQRQRHEQHRRVFKAKQESYDRRSVDRQTARGSVHDLSCWVDLDKR